MATNKTSSYGGRVIKEMKKVNLGIRQDADIKSTTGNQGKNFILKRPGELLSQNYRELLPYGDSCAGGRPPAHSSNSA